MKFSTFITFVTTFYSIAPHCICDYLYPGASQIPEIIINRNVPPGTVLGSGYVYPIPQNPFPPATFLPPLQDEIPIHAPYLPPPENGLQPPINDVLPPQNDYLPPQSDPHIPSSSYGVPGFKMAAVVKVIAMSCLDTTQNRFFKATIQSSEFRQTLPVFPKDNSGCFLTQQSSETFAINLEGLKVGDCGVHYCADKKLCLQLKLPTVKGLKLPEDRIVSLQCIPQSSIASVVKTLAIKPQIMHARARNLQGTVAVGGAQRPFEPHIAIYRKGNNYEYNQLVETGSIVLLGEDLLLKATIKESDGWKFVKMGAVTIQQGIQKGNNRKSIILVDQKGCRVEEMKSICPDHPKQLDNLVITLPFRAFLFQDAQDNEEMLLSVRLYACMNYEDCQAPKYCEEKAAKNVGSSGRATNPGSNNKRIARSLRARIMPIIANSTWAYHQDTAAADGKLRATMQDYESHLDFRVVQPNEFNPLKAAQRTNIYNWYIITCALLFTAIIGLSILNAAIYIRYRSKGNLLM